VATNDTGSTNEDTPVTVTVTANDTDIDGTIDASTVDLDPATPGVQNTFSNTSGSWSVNTSGEVTFTPALNYIGTATISYVVQDNGGEFSNPATISIEVGPSTAVNPVATNDSITTTAGQDIIMNILNNDLKGSADINNNSIDLDPSEPGVQHVITLPGKGTATVDATGLLHFEPEPGFTGMVEFNYSISDVNGNESNIAKVTISILSSLPEGVVIPNAFSPNGDGQNDQFIIEGAEQLGVALYVYNRWGNIVYSNSNYKNSWEGNTSNAQDPGNATKISLGTNDSKLPDGTYFYIVEFADQSKRYSGFVELRR
jgi:gliding motility-associated-like protein